MNVFNLITANEFLSLKKKKGSKEERHPLEILIIHACLTRGYRRWRSATTPHGPSATNNNLLRGLTELGISLSHPIVGPT